QMSDGPVTLYELATGQPRRTYGSKLPPTVKPRRGFQDDLLMDMLGSSVITEQPGACFAISPDGKLLTRAEPDGSIHVWSALTGKEVAVLKGHTGSVNALAFAPDGKTLASAGHDTTALIWDVTRLARPAPAARSPQPGDLETWWQGLADNDAGKAVA